MLIKNNKSNYWEADIPDSELSGFSFEKIDVEYWFQFLRGSPWFPPLIAVGYVALCVSLHTYMKKSQPKKVEAFYAVWCAFWAIFSFCIVVRWIGDWAYAWKVTQSSLHATYRWLCEWRYTSNRFFFWSFLFIWSKAIMFGDTLFLILLKKELTMFHFLHHFAVFVSVTVAMIYDPLPWYRFFLLLNSANLLFYYFFLTMKTLKVRLPSFYKKFMVTFEVAHMAVVPFIHYLVTYLDSKGLQCASSATIIPLLIGCPSLVCVVFIFTFMKNPVAGKKGKERVD